MNGEMAEEFGTGGRLDDYSEVAAMIRIEN